MLDINTAWSDFLDDNYSHNKKKSTNVNTIPMPKCNELYISTRTKISYLNQPIDLHSMFWKIPLISYYEQKEGIIKKQMKFNSLTKESLHSLLCNVDDSIYTEQYIINNIDNPNGRIKFKDTLKISIGICKKDILTYRCKKKSAFYNCFVVIMRVVLPGKKKFKEMHVKVFNTGKLEIPGI